MAHEMLSALRFARRGLRGGIAGLRIFFLCLLLGTFTIAGVVSLGDAFLAGLAEQGQTLLGGDVAVEIVHRPASAPERAFFARYGRVSETASLRAMAYALTGGARTLVELRAVDARWPLFGAPRLEPAQDIGDTLACEADGVCGMVAEQSLLDRLDLQRHQLLRVGRRVLRVMAVIESEPDRIAAGFSLGPHMLISAEALAGTGLVMPGSLIDYSYRIAFARRTPIAAFRAAAAAAFPDAGWQIRDRTDPAPGVRRFIEQVTLFLTLVGLTALGVGGVGAGQAISAFLDCKRAEIATLKSLGAGSGLVILTYFAQVMAVAASAVLLGAAGGAAIPFALHWAAGDALPAPVHLALYPGALGEASGFGLLSAIAFALPPLARARAIAPASLFRDVVAPVRARGGFISPAIAALCILALAVMTVAVAPTRLFAAEFLGGAAALLGLLRLLAAGLRLFFQKLPRPRRPLLRLALANLTRPGAAMAGVVIALGLGLALLAAVILLSRTITAEVTNALPARAPSFFFVDIQPDEAARFDAVVKSFASAKDYERTPMIRGRITEVKGIPAAQARVARDSRWALSGDRGITYAATPPPGTHITKGQWWPADYRGPTLVSLDAAIAEGMDLKIGDTLKLNVLGREIGARIANLRKVDFTTGGQNFVLVLSPGIIDKAPHSFLATVRVAARDEDALYRAVTDRFENVSAIRVKDTIARIDALVQQLAEGVRAASLVTILAGLLVLAGAVAAAGRARLYDATILKVLGATRAQIALLYCLEYGVLGLATGMAALAAGTLAARLIAGQVLDMPFVFDWQAALATVAGGGAATLLFGLFGDLGALRARPARLLRAP